MRSGALGWTNPLRAPAMFTPGDNDCTDCDRPSNGGPDSLERPERERAIFFAAPLSMSERRLLQEMQTDPLCLGFGGRTVPCVENRRWTVGRVTDASFNVQRACNDLCDVSPDPAEFAARNAANIRWLQQTFALATARGSVAVTLISQGNPGCDAGSPTRAPPRNPRTLAQVDG